jgi:hypothetical protein
VTLQACLREDAWKGEASNILVWNTKDINMLVELVVDGSVM